MDDASPASLVAVPRTRLSRSSPASVLRTAGPTGAVTWGIGKPMGCPAAPARTRHVRRPSNPRVPEHFRSARWSRRTSRPRGRSSFHDRRRRPLPDAPNKRINPTRLGVPIDSERIARGSCAKRWADVCWRVAEELWAARKVSLRLLARDQAGASEWRSRKGREDGWRGRTRTFNPLIQSRCLAN